MNTKKCLLLSMFFSGIVFTGCGGVVVEDNRETKASSLESSEDAESLSLNQNRQIMFNDFKRSVEAKGSCEVTEKATQSPNNSSCVEFSVSCSAKRNVKRFTGSETGFCGSTKGSYTVCPSTVSYDGEIANCEGESIDLPEVTFYY